MKGDKMGRLIHYGAVEPPKGFEKATHDLEKFPYPYKDDSVHICLMPHVLEHVKPWLVFRVFNELWRIMRANGQLAVSMPYAGSAGFWGDPTHCTGFNERSFQYLSVDHLMRDKKKTKPWKIEKGSPTYLTNGNIECILRPVKP